MLEKINMSLSKMISLRSARFIESKYALYHVSSVTIEDFILVITWYIIHNKVALAFSRIKFKV